MEPNHHSFTHNFKRFSAIRLKGEFIIENGVKIPIEKPPYSVQALDALRLQWKAMPRQTKTAKLKIMPEGEGAFRRFIQKIIDIEKVKFQLQGLNDFEYEDSDPHRFIFRGEGLTEFFLFQGFIQILCNQIEEYHFTHYAWTPVLAEIDKRLFEKGESYHRTRLIPDQRNNQISFFIEIKKPEIDHDYSSDYYKARLANAEFYFKQRKKVSQRPAIVKRESDAEEEDQMIVIPPLYPEVHLHIVIDLILNYEGIFELQY